MHISKWTHLSSSVIHVLTYPHTHKHIYIWFDYSNIIIQINMLNVSTNYILYKTIKSPTAIQIHHPSSQCCFCQVEQKQKRNLKSMVDTWAASSYRTTPKEREKYNPNPNKIVQGNGKTFSFFFCFSDYFILWLVVSLGRDTIWRFENSPSGKCKWAIAAEAAFAPMWLGAHL
jgi:hypothetical protein